MWNSQDLVALIVIALSAPTIKRIFFRVKIDGHLSGTEVLLERAAVAAGLAPEITF